MKCSKQSGFTLVELAVVLLIAGLVIASTISMVKPYMQSVQRNTTKAKLENISQTLALFAQQYGRLPCPGDPAFTDISAEPFGAPRNAGPNGRDILNNAGCGTNNRDYKGIVPFRALGLDESQVRDSYGNLISYAVTPAMTLYRPLAGTTGQRNVHNACRTATWVEGSVNKNVHKAHVCCAPLSGISSNIDIRIFSERTKTNALYPARGHSSSDYGNPNPAPTDVAVNPALDRNFIAFVLISHGPNGDGAYLGRNSEVRERTTNATVTEETENRDLAVNENLEFVARSTSIANSDEYFDDILVWKTNEQLINLFGNDSCVRP